MMSCHEIVVTVIKFGFTKAGPRLRPPNDVRWLHAHIKFASVDVVVGAQPVSFHPFPIVSK